MAKPEFTDLDRPLWSPTAEQPEIERPPGNTAQIRHRTRRDEGPPEAIPPPVGAPLVIAMFGAKGGVGTSTTTFQVGQVLAMARGEPVVALDANPHSGNLVTRVGAPPSRWSVGELSRDHGQVRRYTDLEPYVTRTDRGLSVVRSDPSAAERPGPRDYQNVLGVLSRFCAVILVDLGTARRDSAFLSIMEVADSAVGVTGPSRDSVEVCADALGWLASRFPGRIADATVVINEVEPTDARRSAAELARRVGRVRRVPWDRHLASGETPRGKTRHAYRELADAVIGSASAREPSEPTSRMPVH